ncbi:colicin-like pore-forming protein [Erwinia sp. BNK-24-b]|uniref:colicin-like pore-forming protein n=1 Tax=unclassified Erwinia TaxID=2622719 RepID=UPI0039BF4D0C
MKAVGFGASMLTAHVFSIMLSTSPGIFGFALMLAIISALITDEKVEKVNKLLGI